MQCKFLMQWVMRLVNGNPVKDRRYFFGSGLDDGAWIRMHYQKIDTTVWYAIHSTFEDMSTGEEDDNLFDDVDVGIGIGIGENAIGENAISTSDDGDVDSLLKELDSEFAIGGDSDDDEEEDVLGLDGGASDVAAATPSIVESAIDSLVASSALSSSPLKSDPSDDGTNGALPPPTSSEDDSEAMAASAAPAPPPGTSVTPERPNTDTDDPVKRLRSSTATLAQSISNRTKATANAVDTKYNIRESLSQGVSKLDSDYNIKTKTSSLWSSLKGGVALVGGSISAGASNVDSRYELSSKASEVKSTVAEKAKVVTSEIGVRVAPAKDALTEMRFGDKIAAVGSSVREVDEKFSISTKAVGALANGADALAKGFGVDIEEGDSGNASSDAPSTSAGDIAAGGGAAAAADYDAGATTAPVTNEV